MQQSNRTWLALFGLLVVIAGAFGSEQQQSQQEAASSNNDELVHKLEKLRELKALLAKLDQEANVVSMEDENAAGQDFDGVNTDLMLNDDEDYEGSQQQQQQLENKRSGAYLRFGRSNPAYLRFGRASNAAPAYLRFGKRLPGTGPNSGVVAASAGSSPVFLRFGKRNPAYLRFGK